MTMKNSSGFTLVELIIVIIILFVIWAIAVPSFFQRIKKEEGIVAQIAKGKMLSKEDFAYYMQHKDSIDPVIYKLKSEQTAEQKLDEAYRNYQNSLQK